MAFSPVPNSGVPTRARDRVCGALGRVLILHVNAHVCDEGVLKEDWCTQERRFKALDARIINDPARANPARDCCSARVFTEDELRSRQRKCALENEDKAAKDEAVTTCSGWDVRESGVRLAGLIMWRPRSDL